MTLESEFEKQGSWLFRYRDRIPYILLPVLLVALREGGFFVRHGLEHLEVFWEMSCVAVSLLGLAVRCATVGCVSAGTSGRNTRDGQQAAELNTTGWYSVVRHPLYLGNFLILLGMLLYTEVWWFVGLVVLAFWLYYERIMYAEERYLERRFGDAFRRWAVQTPTFLPDFRLWRSPGLSFCWRTVLRREYTAFFQIAVGFTVIHLLINGLALHRFRVEASWVAFSLFGATVYAVLRTMKRKTQLLEVSGR